MDVLKEQQIPWGEYSEAVYRELCADFQKHKNEITLIKEAVKLGNLSVYQVKNAEAVIDEKAARKMASDLLVDTIGQMDTISQNVCIGGF